jgi:hypothetical protein
MNPFGRLEAHNSWANRASVESSSPVDEASKEVPLSTDRIVLDECGVRC